MGRELDKEGKKRKQASGRGNNGGVLGMREGENKVMLMEEE